ncbi:hypothetical protein D3C81_1891770 [compost metagenome]
MRHALFTEVHAVDQVVLQFMGQRRKKSIQQQACPPGHVPRHVQRRRTDHPGQGEGQNARAKGILMIEQRVALAQFDASGEHHLADMRRSLLCILALGTCRSTVHASIL